MANSRKPSMNFHRCFLVLLTLLPAVLFAQPDLPKAPGPENNKSVGICGQYGDTLLLDQIACGDITIDSKKPVTVTSFYFSYYLHDNMTLKTEHFFSNSTAKDFFEKFKQARPTRVYIQDILGESADGILILGNRDI